MQDGKINKDQSNLTKRQNEILNMVTQREYVTIEFLTTFF